MQAFFFDTADPEAIKRTWDRLSGTLPSSQVLGVTTNPSAWHKQGIDTIAKAAANLQELCRLVTEIRGDSGVSYMPKSPTPRVP